MVFKMENSTYKMFTPLHINIKQFKYLYWKQKTTTIYGTNKNTRNYDNKQHIVITLFRVCDLKKNHMFPIVQHNFDNDINNTVLTINIYDKFLHYFILKTSLIYWPTCVVVCTSALSREHVWAHVGRLRICTRMK